MRKRDALLAVLRDVVRWRLSEASKLGFGGIAIFIVSYTVALLIARWTSSPFSLVLIAIGVLTAIWFVAASFKIDEDPVLEEK